MMPFRSALWSSGTVLVAAAVAYLVARLAVEGTHEHEPDFHEWLHRHLNLSEDQEARLVPVEAVFERTQEQIRGEVAAAGRALALAIRDFDGASPEVEVAHHRLIEAQAKLQKTTLDHFFVMKEYLDPEQGMQLLEWTHDSLLNERRN